MLAYDYTAFNRLLKSNAGGANMEGRLLMIDYRMMAAWHRLTAHISPAPSRGAAARLIGIVDYLANPVGERSA